MNQKINKIKLSSCIYDIVYDAFDANSSTYAEICFKEKKIRLKKKITDRMILISLIHEAGHDAIERFRKSRKLKLRMSIEDKMLNILDQEMYKLIINNPDIINNIYIAAKSNYRVRSN